MAPNNSRKATGKATLGKIPVPCHVYDDWLLPAARTIDGAKFASAVIDVARGARAIASIVAEHIVDLNAIADGGRDSVEPLMSESNIEALARLAVFSLDQLQRLASDQVDAINTKAEVGSQA